MKEGQFNKAMTELDRQIEALPEERRAALRALAAETRRRDAEIRDASAAGMAAAAEFGRAVTELIEVTAKLTERVDDARLAVKYAMFDAEAREREKQGIGRDHG